MPGAERSRPRLPAAKPASFQRLAQFTLRQPLGSGGMGQVWAAFDERLQREVAFKLIRP